MRVPPLFVLVLLQSLLGCQFEPLVQRARDWPCVRVALNEPASPMRGLDVHASVAGVGSALRTRIEQFFRDATPSECCVLEARPSIAGNNADVQPSGVVTRRRLSLHVTFFLYDQAHRCLLSGSSRAASSYDLVRREYSNFVAEEHLIMRLVEIVARDIEMQLIGFFNTYEGVRSPNQKIVKT